MKFAILLFLFTISVYAQSTTLNTTLLDCKIPGTVRVIENPNNWGGYGVFIRERIEPWGLGDGPWDWVPRRMFPNSKDAKEYALHLIDSVNYYHTTGLSRGKVILVLKPNPLRVK